MNGCRGTSLSGGHGHLIRLLLSYGELVLRPATIAEQRSAANRNCGAAGDNK